MKRNPKSAITLLSLIALLVCWTSSSDLHSADLTLVYPNSFNRCVDTGSVEFKWQYNALPSNASITDAKLIITNNTSKEKDTIPVIENETITVNSNNLELVPKAMYTWTIIAKINNEDITASPNHFALTVKPEFGEESLENNITCVPTKEPVVFYWGSETADAPLYHIELSDDISFDSLIKTDPLGIHSAYADLMPNTTYYWRLQDVNCEDNYSDIRVLSTELAPIANITPENLGTCEDLFVENDIYSIKLGWDNPNIGSTYSYNLKIWNVEEENRTAVLNDTIATTEYILNISGLYDKLLEWEVVVIDEVNDCTSKLVDKAMFFTPLKTPELVEPIDKNCVLLNATFNWYDAETASKLIETIQGYEFWISENMEFPETETKIVTVPKLITDEDDPENLSTTIVLDKPSTTYYWKMRKLEVLETSINDDELDTYNYSQWSSTFNFSTTILGTKLISPPDSAFGVDEEVELVWESNTQANSYILEIAMDSDFENIIHKDTISDTTYTYKTTSDYRDYYWKVSCEKSSGDEEGCQSDFTEANLFSTSVLHPVIIQPAPLSELPSNNVLFKWHTVKNANVYDIEYTKTEDAFNQDPAQVIYKYNIVDTAMNMVLEQNTIHYWRIRAKNSDWSPVYSFTTGQPAPDVATLISPSNNQENVSRLSNFLWNQVNNAKNYQLQIATLNSFEETNIVLDTNLSDTTYTIGDIYDAESENTIKILSPSTRYYWRVRGTSNDNLGNWSNIWAFNTFPDKPTTPANLLTPSDNAVDVDYNSITFTWGNHAQAQYYNLIISKDNEEIVLDTNIIGKNNCIYSELDSSTTYYWKVLPCNENGLGTEWSEEFTFKTAKYQNIIDNSIINSISIAPNPANNSSVLQIGLTQTLYLNIKVFDINGNLIQNINTTGYQGTNSMELASKLLPNMNLLAKGTYSIMVYSNNKLLCFTSFVFN